MAILYLRVTLASVCSFMQHVSPHKNCGVVDVYEQGAIKNKYSTLCLQLMHRPDSAALGERISHPFQMLAATNAAGS